MRKSITFWKHALFSGGKLLRKKLVFCKERKTCWQGERRKEKDRKFWKLMEPEEEGQENAFFGNEIMGEWNIQSSFVVQKARYCQVERKFEFKCSLRKQFMKIGLYRKVLLLFASNDSEEVVLTGYDSSSGAQFMKTGTRKINRCIKY